MKSQKLINLGLSVSLSMTFAYFLLNNELLSLIGVGSTIGLLAEAYYFFNFFFGGKKNG